MFCAKCGSQIPEGAAFCPDCGQTVGNRPENENPSSFGNQQNTGAYQPGGQYQSGPGQPYPAGSSGTAAGSGSRKKIIAAVIAVLAVAVIVIVLVINLFGGDGYSSYKKLIKDCTEAFVEGDGAKVIDALPEEVLELYPIMNEGFLQDVREELSSFPESFNPDNEKWDYSYKIVDEKNISRAELKEGIDSMMETELPSEFEDDKDAQQALEDFREMASEIENVKEVETEVTVEIGDEPTKFSMAFTVAEIDGEWYLFKIPAANYAE